MVKSYKLKKVEIILCEDCLNGEGVQCHTPGCALFLHHVPGPMPIMPELYRVKEEWWEHQEVMDKKS